MQSISIFSKIIRFFVAFVVAVFLSCFESHADDCVLGTDGCAPEFTVTTTELSAGTTFSFEISAAGTYYIDWGDGGAIETIVKNSVGEQTITHTYTNAGQYTIGMAGQATLYSSGIAVAAISFKENTNISGISGSLGAIFGTLTDRVNSDGTLMSDAQPRFYRTFFGCSNLSGNIPENLFAGISGAPARSMFYSTFDGCSGLSGSIPENLFAGINGAPASYMFNQTFYNCSGLSGSIPANLFAGINGAPASYMFNQTFYNCSGLSGSIPENLFAGISGAPADYMFYSTFSGCDGLSGSIPENLFAGINGAPASYMFSYTFYNCSGLSGSIPENLFAEIKGAPASNMFAGTFSGCSGLSGSIPENLFAGISGAPADAMFRYTFFGCSNLSGNIPENLFAGISGAPASYMFSGTFSDCSNLSGNIPANLFAGIKGAPASNMFAGTFSGCSGLSGSIPENLFAGISGAPASYMFGGTFVSCRGLSGSIPENLFAGISGAPADFMFNGTFSNCSGLSGSIPENLFAGIKGAPANSMFYGTFNSCSGLSGSIPENLFAGISGAPADYMFMNTFSDCSGLSGSIPENLFAGISGAPASYMFSGTFSGCSNLSGNIPANLFAGISGAPASYMFSYTFYNCRGLSGSIPENLFAEINGAPADGMFYQTFFNCSNLSGNIPENLFAGINGAPASHMFCATFLGCRGLSGYVPANLFTGIDKTTTASDQMDSVFYGTGLEASCPASTYQYLTGFESYFNGKVACSACPADYPNADSGATSENECYRKCTTDDVAGAHSVTGNNYYGTGVDTCQEVVYYISAGEYLPAGGEEPADCPNGSYCPGVGDVRWDEKNDQGLVVCPVDYPNSDTGAKSESDCYKPCKTEDVPGATGEVTGNNYYGSVGRTCAVTECADGWRFIPEKNLMEVIGEKDPVVNIADINYTDLFSETNYDDKGAKGKEYYGISDNMSYAVDFGDKGMLIGHGRCNKIWHMPNGAEVGVVDNLSDETGQDGADNCYCQIDGYILPDGNKFTFSSAPWVVDWVNTADCATNCAGECADIFKVTLNTDWGVLHYRPAIFGNQVVPATCEEITYTLNPGEYLPAGGEEPADCPNGSYCPGVGDVRWDEKNDQGLVVCPVDYPNSDTGAKSENQCYKQCTTDDVAGAMTVVGTDYYGGLNTCDATECVAGWHVKAGLDIGETIGEEKGANSAYINNNGSFGEENFDNKGIKGQEYYGISDKNSFAVDYEGKGMLTGHGRCSTQEGYGIWTDYKGTPNNPEDVTVVNTLADETGQEGAQYCYCQVDGFTPTGGDKVMVTSAPWVFRIDGGSAGDCAGDCARNCAGDLRTVGVNNLPFRAAVMDSLPASPATCEEIIYTLNPGEYLPVGGEEPVDCPNGSYCPGVGDVRYDEKNDQGLVACPTDFPNSDTGAKSENDCYKPCTTDDVANSMSVVGKIYYGTGADTCLATECMAGWHVKAGLDIGETIGEEAGTNSAYIDNNSSFSEINYDGKGSKGQEYYGISGKNSFAVDYEGKGILTGHGRCSTQPGVREFDYSTNTAGEITIVNSLTDETGQSSARYCYCQVDGFTPTGGDKVMVTSAPWVFYFDGSNDSCASNCAANCAYNLRSDDVSSLAFRAAVMNNLPALPGICEEITYTLNPGEYLPAGGTEPTDCPSGSYCPGGETVYWNKDEDQGIKVCPSDYPNSDSGAKSENDCYKQCTTDDVANSMSVVGKNYYGDGADTCAATECMAGWHVKPGLDIGATIGEERGANSAYINNNGSFGEMNYDGKGSKGQEYYGISDKNSFAVDYAGKGMLTGHGRCSTQAGVRNFDYNTNTLKEITIVNILADETGVEGAQYCYCQVDGFTPTGGTKAIVTSAPWMFRGGYGGYGGSADGCASNCASNCAYNLRDVDVSILAFRAAVMNSLPALPGTCEEITYTLNPGEYLPAGGTEPTDCPSGSYCPGAGDVKYDEEKDQGLVACPVDYPNSDTGAKSENDCYKQCTTDDVAGAMTVIGTDYYGDGLNTCEPTACMAGWHKKPRLDIGATIGEEAGANSAYINNNGYFSEDNFDNKGKKGQEYYGISDKNSFAVDYAGKGILTGHGRCSTQAGSNNNLTWTNPTIVNNFADETGMSDARYCYCSVDGFTPAGGTKAIVTSAPWVFYNSLNTFFYCTDDCTHLCANILRNVSETSLAFRAAVLNGLPALPATCEEITYTLNPGEYLPAGGEEPVDCPNGYYCPGGVVRWKEENIGLVACPDGYDNSDSGAKTEADCYKPCVADDVPGAMSVTGKNYYGSNGSACEVTECADGWRNGGISDVIGKNQADKRGVVYPDYFSEDVWSGDYMDQDYYGISEVNSFAVDYGNNGMVKGRGICSTKQGEFNYDWDTNTLNVTTFDELDDETGNYDAQYCYCQVDEYVPSGGSLSQSVSGKWVFHPSYYSSDDCRYYCGSYCASMMVWSDDYRLSFRNAVLGGGSNSENQCKEILYKIPAGQYIVAGSTEPTKCPSGYYCPGMGDVRLSDDKDQGLVACPDGYDNSDTGAKTESDCYKPCVADDVAGAMSVTGKNYYGDGADTCAATECVAGWMVKDLSNVIKNASASNSTYINNNGDITDSENKGLAYYGISDKNSFAVDYGRRGILTGHGRCSTQEGVYNFDWNTYTLTDVTVVDSLADETGMDGAQYCYCQVDGFTPVGELTQILSDQPWVYYRNHWNSGSCANDCARTCSDLLRSNGDEGMAMRQVLFGPSMCVQASYRLNAGTYLPAGDDAPTKCPVGYYCPGVVNVKPDEENDQGLFQCPVDYPDSDEGAMGDTYCYTSCKLENMDAENVIAVTGKDYYGTGEDTCVPSECAAGWIVQDLTGIAGQSYASNSAYVSTNSGVVGLVDSNGRDMMYYGISELNSFALDFGSKGIITGRARCSTIEGTNNDYTWTDPTILDELADETGQSGAYHCYCQVDGFTMPNKVVQQVSGPWVYRSNYWGDYEYCASSCVGDCVQQLKYNNSDNIAFRKAMFVPTMCVQESYRINAGTYLPAGDDAPAKCPVGYYCPGVVNVKLDEENDQGLSKCPSEYPNSDTGATADTQCYTKCTINDVANSMTVVGNNYYGTGTDTCEASECAPGWLLDLGLGEYAVCADTLSYIEPGTYLPAGKTVVEICLPGSYCPGADNVSYNVDANQGIFACPTEYPNSYTGAKADTECYQTCKIDNGDVTTSGNGNIYYGDENNTCELTECADGWMLKDFAKKIGTENGINSAYVSTNSMSYGQFVEDEWINDSVMGQMYYGISEPGEFAVGFGENGMITGRGRCSTKSGVQNYDWGTQEYSEITTFDELDDESGNDEARYCYCHVDSYTSVGGLTQVLSRMPWVFNSESWSGESCGSNCASECVAHLRNIYDDEDIAFRAVAFGAKPQDPAICIEESYRIKPGVYLMAGEDTPTKCPSGSYCPGAGDVILNSDKNQGIVKCPSGYPYSDTGATDDTQCYSLCTTGDVANSTSVIGNDYYGDGADTCSATQCVAGWKLRDLSAIIGNIPGANSAYISSNSSSYGEFRDNAGLNQDYYGLSEPGEFAVDYGDTGIITGRARCSTKPGVGGTNPTVFKELDDESGVNGAQYCYCQVNGYFKQGELIQAISGPWVYSGNCSSDGTSMCEDSCGNYLKWNGTKELAFRSVMFGGATCEQTKYRLNAGTYLPAGKESVEQCVSGSYCPGADNITIDANNNQGIVACPSGYPKSDIGAKADTQCYTDCTAQDVEHAMTVVGRDYYGDGKDTCKVTECVSGWHVKLGLNLEELVGSTYEGSNSSYMAGTNSAYINNAGDFVEYGQYEEYGQEYYGISENNSFAVIYDDDKGMITGRARCSSQSENSVENLPDESGNSDAYNCYCTIDSYTPVDGTKQTISAPWIKYGSINWYSGACESNCVQNCASNMREHMSLDFRGKMFEASMEIPMCLANKININWNLGYGDNNSSTTTCSYNEVIVLPQEPVRPGYIFTGWKVLKSNQ